MPIDPNFNYDPDSGGGLSRLMGSLVAIQQNKEAKKRQATLDAQAAEMHKQQMEQQQLQRDILLADLTRKNAAETPVEAAPQIPAETKAPEVGPPAPEGLTKPSRSLSINYQGKEIPLAPLQYKEEAQAQQAQDFQTKLQQAFAMKDAQDQAESYTLGPEFGDLAGVTVPKNAVGAALTGLFGSKKPSTVGQISPTAIFQSERQFRQDFEKGAQAYRTVHQQKSVLDSSFAEAQRKLAKGETINWPSQSIITSFNRIIDPNSTVRESEYARSPEGQSYLARVEGFIQRAKEGGAGLTIPELKGATEAAAALMTGYEDQAYGQMEQLNNQLSDPRLHGGHEPTPEEMDKFRARALRPEDLALFNSRRAGTSSNKPASADTPPEGEGWVLQQSKSTGKKRWYNKLTGEERLPVEEGDLQFERNLQAGH